tara:strand:- start:691 stop:1104 length:414 start_codon:yes stop_codon:yes gene_type:complete
MKQTGLKQPKAAKYSTAFGFGLAFLFFSDVSAGVLSGQDPGETIEIIAAHLEGRLDAEPTSGYNLLLTRILPTQSHYLKYQRYPLSRAIRKFREAKRVCLFPSSISVIQGVTNIHPDGLRYRHRISALHFSTQSEEI